MNIYPKINGNVAEWDMIVMGHLKVNPYFGESYDSPPRGDPSTCSSVMIRGLDEAGRPYVLIVDPTVRLAPEDYYFDINRRTGLHKEDVTHCFVTHHHSDHYEALSYFPGTRWLAAPPVADILRKEAVKIDASAIAGVSGEFLPGVSTVFLPGHTGTLHGVAFMCQGKKILIAADAVMSRHHFIHETTDFQPDPDMNKTAAQTIRSIKESFDIVVPGHDNIVIIK